MKATKGKGKPPDDRTNSDNVNGSTVDFDVAATNWGGLWPQRRLQNIWDGRDTAEDITQVGIWKCLRDTPSKFTTSDRSVKYPGSVSSHHVVNLTNDNRNNHWMVFFLCCNTPHSQIKNRLSHHCQRRVVNLGVLASKAIVSFPFTNRIIKKDTMTASTIDWKNSPASLFRM